MILDTAPEGAKVLDLDAAREARAEAKKDEPNPVIKLQAGYVELRKEVDVTAAEDFKAGNLIEGLGKLLADPADIAALTKDGFSSEDLSAVMMFVTGRSLGE